MSVLDRDWNAVPGASDEAIDRLRKAVPIRLPESYVSLLRLTNGGEGPLSRPPFYFCLDSAEYVADVVVNKTHEEFFPGFLMIGSNGGGEFIAFDLRTPGTLPLVALDMNNADLTETVLPVAENFDAFIEVVGVEATD